MKDKYIGILLNELKDVFSEEDVIEFSGSSLSKLIYTIEQLQKDKAEAYNQAIEETVKVADKHLSQWRMDIIKEELIKEMQGLKDSKPNSIGEDK